MKPCAESVMRKQFPHTQAACRVMASCMQRMHAAVLGPDVLQHQLDALLSVTGCAGAGGMLLIHVGTTRTGAG